MQQVATATLHTETLGNVSQLWTILILCYCCTGGKTYPTSSVASIIQLKKKLCMHAQSCPTLCNPNDCSPPGSSVHGIFQARILEWVAIFYSRGSSWPRDQTRVSGISCIGRRVPYHCVTCVAHKLTDDDPNGLSSSPLRLFPTQTLCGSWDDYSFLDTSSQSLQHNPLCYLLLFATPSPGLLFLYPSLCKCESSPKFPFLTNFSSCSTDFPISNGLHHSVTPIISLGQHFQNSSPVQLSLLNVKPKFPFLTSDIFIWLSQRSLKNQRI